MLCRRCPSLKTDLQADDTDCILCEYIIHVTHLGTFVVQKEEQGAKNQPVKPDCTASPSYFTRIFNIS